MLRRLAIGLVALLYAGSVYAAAGPEEARRFVDDVGKQVVAIVNGSGAEEAKRQQLRQLFTEHVAMDWMGQFVLARAWNQANNDQKARYLQAYREYLLSRYTTNFSDYAGSKYTITGVKPAAPNEFTVAMAVNAPHAEDQEVQAGYRVRDAGGGQFKIIDIIVEGVSLLTTERSEFASVVQKGGMEKLIADLQSKTAVPDAGKSK